MRVLLVIILSWIFWFSSAFAGEIDRVSSEQAGNGEYLISLTGSGLSSKDVKIFEIPGEDYRIVVDISNATSKLMNSGVYSSDSQAGLDKVRGAVRNKDDIRFVLHTAGGKLKNKSVTASGLTITIKGGKPKTPKQASATTTPDVYTGDIPTPRIKPAPPRMPVVVIDAGHGGHDPGAIGGTGLQEKKVTLAAAQELRRQLLATGKYKVVLSRDNDRYIEHEDRLRVARANGADLFISLHADATDGKSARGASVYTLADRAKNRSKRIVNSQNWIMDVNLSEQSDSVGNILVDLAQRNTLSQSTQFADVLIGELGQSTQLLRNTHRRAGYYVLLAPDVPAVLLELGFISNPQDEALLKTSHHKRKLMSSVTTAINRYFARQKS